MRLIDADSAKLAISDYKIFRCQLGGLMDVAEFIDDQPTTDAVPVVRCRECKQGEIDDPDFPDEYYCHEGCGWNKGDFYCAYGERKEGAE